MLINIFYSILIYARIYIFSILYCYIFSILYCYIFLFFVDIYFVLCANRSVLFCTGLCGNFNQDPSDDFMLDYGISLTREDFIHNWKTDFSCNVSP